MRDSSKGRGIISIVLMLILSISLVELCPDGLTEAYLSTYVACAISIFCCGLLISHNYIKNGFDIFDPFTVISALYIAMYFVTPIYDICEREYYWFGYELFKYGAKTTVIAFCGYLAFYIFYSYYLDIRKKSKRFSLASEKIVHSAGTGTVYIPLVLVMYAFCFAANVFYLSRYNGNSLLYMLTLGVIGEGGTIETTESSIGFISMFSYSLPAITLIYWEYGKSKALKWALFVPMLMLQVVTGFRFFVLQIAITFLAYYYIKKGKRPRLATMLLVFAVIMVPIIVMTMFRVSLRTGLGIDMSSVSMVTLQNAFEEAVLDNFRIYQNVYGMVGVIPSRYPYVYGRQIFWGTLFMVIPRIIWPGKLSSYGGYGLAKLIGKDIADGQAYPNIGEFYYAFGTLGVIFFMALYGKWMKYVRDRFKETNCGLDLITYAVLLGTNLQIIIRGYTPSNFWYVVFAIIPVWIARKFLYREENK